MHSNALISAGIRFQETFRRKVKIREL